MTTNLPPPESTGKVEVREFFDKYFQTQVTFPVGQIDAVVGFFLKRNFQEQAARSTAIVLLNQAKIDNVNVFELLDSLKGLTDLNLNHVVTEVLNTSRDRSSTLGYTIPTVVNTTESRNIRA